MAGNMRRDRMQSVQSRSQTPTFHSVSMVNRNRNESEFESQQSTISHNPLNVINSMPKFSHIKLTGPAQSYEQSHSDQETHSNSLANRVPPRIVTRMSRSASTVSLYKAKFENSAEIDEDHDRAKLYYICNWHDILGPYTTKEIVSLYVRRKIKFAKTVWITRATACVWHPLEIPQNIKFVSKERLKEIYESNERIKSAIPEIYECLVENIINNKILPVIVPKTTPKKSATVTNKFFAFFGIILTVLMWLIIGIHFIVSLIICSIFYWFPVSLCFAFNRPYTRIEAILTFIKYLLSYSGMVLVPMGVIYTLVFWLQLVPELTSLMYSYLIWGTLSFITTMLMHAAWLFGHGSGYSMLGNYLLFIIGVDLSGHEVSELNHDEEEEDADTDSNCCSQLLQEVDLYIAYIFPALASVLPAAVSGFLLNFIFEEQYMLNCSVDVEDDSLCFDEKCCEIVSSHDVGASFTSFAGDFASNILAVFALIRIIGFLIVNANPAFSVYARRVIY